jgi:hypothetical protein
MAFQDILEREKVLGQTKYRHEILVKGSDFGICKGKVLYFFEHYQLVRYSHIIILEDESLSASTLGYEKRLEKAILKNRYIVDDLIKELQAEGINSLDDIGKMPQGYKSKMLHVITHFLDGFFGIDTFFYNLEEDSHWVSEELQKKITEVPTYYWILAVEANI